MAKSPFDLPSIRSQFPGLQRIGDGAAAVFFDGPAGSQVPRVVADAMRDYLLLHNANHGGSFSTSQETDAMVEHARSAAADFVGATDPQEIVFGHNMTTLTFHLARALARTWRPGDEVVVTASDHDANVMPWTIAARDAGCTVHSIAVRADATLDLDDAARKIGKRTRLVAVGAASNLSGCIHPVAAVAGMARAHGALTFVDAVHFAPHLRTDVKALGCDFLCCSAYKFFGPHLGLLWGRREVLEALSADKVRPSPDHGGEKWQTGTANFEAIAGTLAAIDYLATLGQGVTRAERLDRAFTAIASHERELGARLLLGLARLPVRVIGIAEPARMAERCPTVSFVPTGTTPAALAEQLARAHIHCWPGNSYALALTTALGLEPNGVLRLGMLHYNTADEVDRVLHRLQSLL